MNNNTNETKLPERTLFWLFFRFKGRIRRKTFIMAAGFLLLPQLIILIQMVKHEGDTGQLVFWFVVLLVAVALSLWSIFSLFVKRLHDLDLPGALALLSFFGGINILFFLFLAFMPSKQVTNEHGPPITSN